MLKWSQDSPAVRMVQPRPIQSAVGRMLQRLQGPAAHCYLMSTNGRDPHFVHARRDGIHFDHTESTKDSTLQRPLSLSVCQETRSHTNNNHSQCEPQPHEGSPAITIPSRVYLYERVLCHIDQRQHRYSERVTCLLCPLPLPTARPREKKTKEKSRVNITTKNERAIDESPYITNHSDLPSNDAIIFGSLCHHTRTRWTTVPVVACLVVLASVCSSVAVTLKQNYDPSYD